MLEVAHGLSEYLRRRHFKPLVNFMLDLSLSDSDRLRFVHDFCWVVNRVVGSLVGFGGCPGRECGVKIRPGCKVSRRSCPPGNTKSHVQALSKQCPSTIQAASKQGRFASKLCLGHMPELCVYNEVGVLQLRPSTPYIILKRENSYGNMFFDCPGASRILPRPFRVPDGC